MAKTIYLAAPATFCGTDQYEHLFYLVAHCFPNNPIIEEQPEHFDLLILVTDEDGSITPEMYSQATLAREIGKLVQLATINRRKGLSLIPWSELVFEEVCEFVRVSRRKPVASPV